MSEKDSIPSLPPEFNPMIPLREDSPQRNFPIKALPPILREMVTGIAETTGTDTAMAATSMLSAVSYCFTGVYRMQGKPDHSEPPMILFAESTRRYNTRQKRNDRRIHCSYYESLFHRKPSNSVVTAADKRKSFYEDVVQIGRKEDSGVDTEDAQLVADCLKEYMAGYQKRNPNFVVFNAVLHMDEATPHLHIDYVPVGHYKRGQDTQNGIAQALKEMGFGEGKGAIARWRASEIEVLNQICLAHGIKPLEPEKSRGSMLVKEYKSARQEADQLEIENTQLKSQNKAISFELAKTKDKNKAKKRYSLTVEETIRFIQLVKGSDKDADVKRIIIFLLFTGTRIGECLALSWEDIDFENSSIHIRHTLAKGPNGLFLDTPKTSSSYRTIGMNDTAFDILKEQKAYCANLKDTLGKKFTHPEMVFPSGLGNYRDRSSVYHSLGRITAGTEFEDMTLHKLRHCNATILLNSGVELKMISEHLGHSGVEITANIYADVLQSQKIKMANILDLQLTEK